MDNESERWTYYLPSVLVGRVVTGVAHFGALIFLVLTSLPVGPQTSLLASMYPYSFSGICWRRVKRSSTLSQRGTRQ